MKKRAKIEVIKGSGWRPDGPWKSGFWWRLVGANGRIVCVSETFDRRPDAIRAAKRAVYLMSDKALGIYVDD